jgi:hypothetical protein
MSQRKLFFAKTVARGENSKGVVTQTPNGTSILPANASFTGWAGQDATSERHDSTKILNDERADRFGRLHSR